MVETEPGQATTGPSMTADDYYAKNRDAVGTTLAQAEELTLEEHYELAAERYQEFNEFYAEVQAEIRSEPWKGGVSDLAIRNGGSSGWAPRDAAYENSYYFENSRWIDASDQDRVEFIGQVAEQWKTRGWEIEHQDIFGASRYVAFTEEGYWLEIFESPRSERIEFTAHTPVYWGLTANCCQLWPIVRGPQGLAERFPSTGQMLMKTVWLIESLVNTTGSRIGILLKPTRQ